MKPTTKKSTVKKPKTLFIVWNESNQEMEELKTMTEVDELLKDWHEEYNIEEGDVKVYEVKAAFNVKIESKITKTLA